MKKNIILLISIFVVLFLSSCGEKDKENITKNTKKPQIETIQVDENIEKPNNNIKRGELKYDNKKEKLYIGGTVEITPTNKYELPEGIKVYKNYKTYNNSTNKQYIFFVTDKTDTVNMIADYYINLFKKLGYKRISEIPEERSPFLEKLEFQLGEKFIPSNDPTQEQSLDEIQPIINIKININSETPKNIQDGMGLTGTFVEIYFNIL